MILKTEVMTHYIFKYTKILDSYLKLLYYHKITVFTVLYFYEQINLALVTPKTLK